MGQKPFNFRLIRAALSVNILAFAAGNAYSWTSPVLPKLTGNVDPANNPFATPITPFEESWIVSLIGFGSMFGPPIGQFAVDKFGRKPTLLVVAVPIIISYFVTAFSRTVEWYYAARILTGICVGCGYSLVPMYIGEIAEDSNRGALGCFMSTMGSIGTIFCYCVGPFVTIQVFSLLCAVPMLMFLVLFYFFAPESPYYLISVDKKTDACSSLKRIRNGMVDKELEEITKNVQNSLSAQVKFKDLFKSKAVTKGLVVGFGLMIFQQCSGISAITSYMHPIFEASGSSISSEISAIIVGIVQLMANFFTARFVDKWGRKVLLVASLSGACLSHASLGTYFYLKSIDADVSSIFWLPVVSLVGYIVFYNIGIGPVTWAMMGELFPPNLKSTAVSITTTFCLFLSFVLMMFYANLTNMIGIAPSVWLFAISCAVGILFIILVVPETKGKSLLQIQIMLGQERKE